MYQKKSQLAVEILKFIFVALLVITPLRFYVAQPFIVSGASMQPTLQQGEYLVIDELTYELRSPHRGDIIIFRYPLDPSIFFVKRVVGLPGETVDIQNGVVSITDGTGKHVLLEPYAPQQTTTSDHTSVTLADDEYYVLGDNRSESSDSRIWGPVQKRFIIGRALMRLYPLDHFAILPGEYSFPQLSTHT